MQQWLAQIGVKTLYITPGSPWENGYCESFNGSLPTFVFLALRAEHPHPAIVQQGRANGSYFAARRPKSELMRPADSEALVGR